MGGLLMSEMTLAGLFCVMIFRYYEICELDWRRSWGLNKL